MRAQRWLSGKCCHGGIAPRPLLIFQNSSPSVSAAIFDDVQSAGLGGGSAAAAGTSPLATVPGAGAAAAKATVNGLRNDLMRSPLAKKKTIKRRHDIMRGRGPPACPSLE